MRQPVRVVHYLNQFFGGIGGEEHANVPVEVRDEPVGPGRALAAAFGDEATVVATIISGDNYFLEESEAAAGAVKKALLELKPDVIVAGPALNAGRYGLACGAICTLAQDNGVPAVTAMYPENPGVLEYGRGVYIVPTGESSVEIPKHLHVMANLALKLARRDEIGPAEAEGYMPRGIRRPGLRDKPASVRAVNMLTARLHGRPFVTEIPIEVPERIEPAAPLADVGSATIALLTSGGLVPKGNPDRLVRGGAKEYFKYSIEGLDTMSPDSWECIHRGFYTGTVNENPNYVLPLHVFRELESEGRIGRLHTSFVSTSGVGTAVAESKRMGAEIASEMKEAGVDACIMVAT
ncbi:MAG: glycine/betaine/sarcosine/D-proline family reductase selenoprotein B [Pirellulaceae bacterium]|nr:glycine/betaine/sarcosine/D-proline family reductase selenoprotein B [Pirellulaceae bacterium]